MKKILVLCSAFLLVLGLSGIAGAYTITFGGTGDVDGNLFSSVPGVVTETFETGSLANPGFTQGWNWSGNGASRSLPNVPNQYVAPFGQTQADTTKFLVVPIEGTNGSVTATGFGTHNYFGIWWGSIDEYNTLSFDNGITLTGSDVSSGPFGSETDPAANKYVNIVFDLPFTQFTMTSTSPAFESDNIAIGDVTVPEPATLILLGAGLVGIGVYARRRLSKK